MKLLIHPSIGIARLGNSPNEICLSPDSIGGLPYDADSHGNLLRPVTNFKDAKGLIKRQGQPFKIFQENGIELNLNSPQIASIEWTVHLASKKAAWYQYSELQGNLLYGESNSYANQNIPFRNPEIPQPDRQSLLIDPGPEAFQGEKNQSDSGERMPPYNIKYNTLHKQ